MCGFTGIIDLLGHVPNANHLQLMTDAISHRGPDGEGKWIEQSVGFGHRRLSVLDLTNAGSQPMHSENSRYVIIYNGEIYNFDEIKTQLEQLGYRFKSNSDTEVVLYSLVEWGPTALLKFNGMFALAFWDRQKKELLLARDRYGIKPLYYAFQNGKFYFASEQKAILANPDFTRKLNKPGLLEYFTFQNFFSDQTLLEDIKTFPAGSFATFRQDQVGLNFKRYWDFDFQNNTSKIDYTEHKEELSRLFEQAVSRQLVSDVEIGSYLSGGLDSGSIAAIAARESQDLKTFTCGFDTTGATDIELMFDERQRAEAMSSFLKTEQYEIVLKAGDMERCLPSLAYHLEEPRVGQSYPNYYIARLASKFVKVVFSGAGGDELFGGYPWRYYKSLESTSFENYIDNYYVYWQRLLSNRDLHRLFMPIKNDVRDVWTRDIFSNVFQYTPNLNNSYEDYVNHSLYFEAKTFLHSLFIVEDKISMAHGLETRVPFMDNDLVDFAMKCPVNFKLSNLQNQIRLNENDPGIKTRKYFQQTNDGKKILRAAMHDLIPTEILEAKKQGFSAPDSTWFKTDSRKYIEATLLSKNSVIFHFLDREVITELCEQHFSGKINRRLLIWSLLNVNAWMEQVL